MNFDFYEQYREYPNVELLKIIAQPGHYQPQAVEAAECDGGGNGGSCTIFRGR